LIRKAVTIDIVRTANEMAEPGFTASYIFAKDITEPEKIVGLLASALPELK
jgi:hypothetical protein